MEVDEVLAPQEDQAVPAVMEPGPVFDDDELDAMEEKEPPWLDEA